MNIFRNAHRVGEHSLIDRSPSKNRNKQILNPNIRPKLIYKKVHLKRCLILMKEMEMEMEYIIIC